MKEVLTILHADNGIIIKYDEYVEVVEYTTMQTAKTHGPPTPTSSSSSSNLLNKKAMDLERVKQHSNEYAEQHIISRGQLEKLLQELKYNNVVISETPQEKPQPNSTFDYVQMTRQ